MNEARTIPAMPITSWARRYRRSYLSGDLLAGLVVAALAIPQSLGYATIAGVPVIVGIYAIPAALLAYALFGSSPHLVVGPVSTVSVLSGSLVAGAANGDPARAVALTTALAVGAGVGLVIGGLARLGWAAEFLSRPIVTGFVFGLVLLIIVGELPHLLGIPTESGDVLQRVGSLITSLDSIDPLTALVGCVALAALFVGAWLVPRMPWGLLVLIGAIVVSSAVGLAERGVVTVGTVPLGLPPLGLPAITASDIPPVLFGGFALALVGLAEGLSAARLFAAREGYRIESNQELIGSGAANIAAGLSGGLGVAGSLSKTAAARRSGSNTQMAGVVAAVVVLLVLVFVADLLSALPRAVLAAIVIQAVWGLMDVAALRRYRYLRRNDFTSAIAAMAGVLILGPLYGLLAAVGLAVLGLVYRSSRVDLEVMGKVPEEKAAWGSIRDHPERKTYDGVVVIRLDAPLFWANASEISDRVLELVDADPTLSAVLVDMEATSQLDTTSIDALELLLNRLRERGIALYLVRVFYEARKILARSGFVEDLGPERMWHSISAGVRAARRHAGLDEPSHPQETETADDDHADADLPPGAERIAADAAHNGDGDTQPAETGIGGAAPRGGYQDPYPAGRPRGIRWFRRG